MALMWCLAAAAQPFTLNDPALLGGFSNAAASPTPPAFVEYWTGSVGAGGTGFTNSSFSASGGNYAVLVIAFRTGGSFTTTPTINAVPMTLLNSASYFTGSGSNMVYGLANPSSGNVAVAFSTAPSTGASAIIMLFSGVHNVGTVASYYPGATAQTSVSQTLTSTGTSNLCFDSLAWSGTGTTVTNGASQTLVTTSIGNGSDTASSTIQGSSSGTTTLSWTCASQRVSWIGVALY